MKQEVVVFDVTDSASQQLEICVEGEDVPNLNATCLDDILNDETESSFLNPVELFIRAVNCGMLCGVDYSPSHSKANLIASETDLKTLKKSWTISVSNIDKSAYRILLNVLLARELERIEIRSLQQDDSGNGKQKGEFSKIDQHVFGYPGYYRPLPFQLNIEEFISSKDRTVHIVYAKEPSEQVVESTIKHLELWTYLIIMGGYPDEGCDPREAGAFPDSAYLFDPFTVAQGFFEAYFSDDASFNAVINMGHLLHEVWPIAKIKIM